MRTVVYSPKPALANPKQFFRSAFHDLRNSWELSCALAKRDISALYRQSILGYVWAFLPVLATTGIFLFLRSGGAFSTGETPLPYPVYLLVGSLLWQVFADAVSGPLKLVTSSRSMITKINFPRESLIIGGMLMTLFNLFVRSTILIPALIYFHVKGIYSYSPDSLLLFPIGLISLICFGYMVGVLLTPIGMLYKDVEMGLTMILGFWMFISPVVILIPATGVVRDFMSWNPVSSLIDVSRAWLLGVDPFLFKQFVIIAPVSFLLLFVVWVMYRVSLPHAIARLGM